jgi:hypothetical protein
LGSTLRSLTSLNKLAPSWAFPAPRTCRSAVVCDTPWTIKELPTAQQTCFRIAPKPPAAAPELTDAETQPQTSKYCHWRRLQQFKQALATKGNGTAISVISVSHLPGIRDRRSTYLSMVQLVQTTKKMENTFSVRSSQSSPRTACCIKGTSCTKTIEGNTNADFAWSNRSKQHWTSSKREQTYSPSASMI